MSVVHRVPALAALWPPLGLSARLRWFFLMFGLFFVVTFIPQLTVSSTRPVALQAAACLTLVALGAWWVRCYRAGAFPWPGLFLECATFVMIGVTADDPFKSLGLLYISVNFRALYGSWRTALGYTAMAIASFFVAIVLAHTLGSVDRLPQFWQSVPGVPVLAVIAHLVSAASDSSERAAARERTLSRSGLALALADDEESVRNVGLSSVVQLLEGVPGVHVEMSLGTAPTPRTGSQVSYVLPLESRDGRMGVLTITADRDLPPETHDALDVLRTQITLSLQNVSLTTTLRHEATHDRLTGLANRTLMELHLEKALRDQPDRTCVLLMDLDGFKQVNDVYGHAAGDDLLRVVSRRIRTTVGDGGLVARLGGDEFVVVLDDAGHDVAAVAQRLIDAVSEPVELAIATVSVGASAGVAPGGHGSTVGAMLREADNAMYAAKRGGRGRFTISRRVRSGGKLPAQAGQL